MGYFSELDYENKNEAPDPYDRPAPQQKTGLLYVNTYYDLSPDKDLSTDPEGNLVMLCRDCAWLHEDQVQWASRGDSESICELCDADNHMRITSVDGTFPPDE